MKEFVKLLYLLFCVATIGTAIYLINRIFAFLELDRDQMVAGASTLLLAFVGFAVSLSLSVSLWRILDAYSKKTPPQ